MVYRYFEFTRVPKSTKDMSSRLELKVFGETENAVWENALRIAERYGYEDFAELKILKW